MTETLLSPSNVLLFGRLVADLEIKQTNIPTSPEVAKPDVNVRAASTQVITNFAAATPANFGGAPTLIQNNKVLVKSNSTSSGVNGIYTVRNVAAGPVYTLEIDKADDDIAHDSIVYVRRGDAAGYYRYNALQGTFDLISGQPSQSDHSPFVSPRTGATGMLNDAVVNPAAKFARIYGFSYEGVYYDLPCPALFLVHGDGEPATELRVLKGKSTRARAPATPSLSGVIAADFQFSDDVRVWSYDKADYSIRMDVTSGMFEQILLELSFSDDTVGRLAGAKVSGAKVSGAKVSGAKVSGAKLSGRWDPSD